MAAFFVGYVIELKMEDGKWKMKDGEGERIRKGFQFRMCSFFCNRKTRKVESRKER
jgi:hypothetical protein